jgi:hypothetical protein
MAYLVTYTGNGSLTDFPVIFPFIDRSHVSVTVNNVPVTFSWLSNAMIRVSPAPANASVVRIERQTPREVLVTWQDGASLKAADLTKDTQQAVFVSEEAAGRVDEAKNEAQEAQAEALVAITLANNALAAANEALAAVTGSGNVPAPSGLQVGFVLEATGPGAFAWRQKDTLEALGGAPQTALDLTNANLSALASSFNARLVSTAGSLTGGGSLAANRTLSLVNDSSSPGNNRYYGTDGSGTKGWFALPGAPDLSPYVTGAANAGTGADVFLSKTGSTLQFRRIRVVNTSVNSGTYLTDVALSVTTSGNDLVITLTKAYFQQPDNGGGN